jgi:hypothetical protein
MIAHSELENVYEIARDLMRDIISKDACRD